MKTTLVMFTLLSLMVAAPLTSASAQVQAESIQTTSIPQGLYSAFLETIASDAVPFHPDRGGFSLDAQGLQVQLNAGVLSVAPQNGPEQNGSEWSWNLRVTGFGRGSNPVSVSNAGATTQGGKVTNHYAGFSEWYRDAGVGIEQGFTIDQSPRGNGGVVLRLQLDTTLVGTLSTDGRSLTFDTGDGGALRYSDLRVFDANGSELDARLIYTPNQIIIQIDDNGAAYPLTVDPLIFLESKRLALDGVGWDNFGYSVAISGDTAVVGAQAKDTGGGPNYGAAYVFTRSRSGGVWIQAAKLTASDGAANDQFGYSVAISGDTVVAGALFHDVGANGDQGSAYIFVKPAAGWADMTETARLTASDGAANDEFGYSVAISGDTVVAGAAYDHVLANADQGSAYVFVKPGGGWATTSTYTAKLTASDGAANDYFGVSVAISGDTVIAGDNNNDVGPNNNQGSAYVFVKPGAGWTGDLNEDAQLLASDGAANDSLGYSVAVSGDTVVAGAYGDTVGANFAQGSAYVFLKPAGGWASVPPLNQTAKLVASDGALNDYLGYSVAISGDTVVAGAYQTNGVQGSTYVFVKPAVGWANINQTAKLLAFDGAATDEFGFSVAVSGDTVVVGARWDDVGIIPNVMTDEGSAYFYFPYRGPEDLAVAAASSSTAPAPAQTITLTTSVTNLPWPPAPATAVLLNAPLPAGLTYVRSVPSVGVYDPSTGSWTVGLMPPGLTATLDIMATVDASAAGQQLTFTSSLLGWDTNNANNSASLSLNVLPYPPAAFNKSAPLNAATDLPPNPTLSWGTSSGATSYAYCIDTTNNNACDTGWVSTGTATSEALSGLAPGTSYYWQVRATNLGGTTYANGGAWWSFTTLPLPAAFNKSSPLNGAVKRSSSPTLKWTASAGATSYEYCIDTSNNNTCNTAWVSAGTATSKTVTGLAHGVRYYWQVRAANAGGTTYANGGVWWSFTTLPLPGVFNKSAPANHAVNQPTNPTLRWGASSNRISYQYCIDTSNNNTCNTAWVSAGTATIKVLSGLAHGVRYYWQVRAVNAAGYRYANAGAWWYFTVH